jgi:TRAP-type C4-dicarboxylate transport system permease small subunit
MKVIGRLALLAALLGGAIAFAIGLMTTVSVVGRAFFLKPIPGDVEITQLGIGLAISLCLPWCQFRGANIMVDFFTQRLALSLNRRLDAIGMLLLAVMYGLLSWRTLIGAVSVKQAFEATMILDLPMWWSYASLAPGLAFAGLIALLQAWMLARGRAADGGHARELVS